MTSKRKISEGFETHEESQLEEEEEELDATGTFLLCDGPPPMRHDDPTMRDSNMFNFMKKILDSGYTPEGQLIDDFNEENVFETDEKSRRQKLRGKKLNN